MDSNSDYERIKNESVKRDLTLGESFANQDLSSVPSELNLTNFEVRSLLSYRGQTSRWINKELRDNGKCTNEKKRIVHRWMQAGLSKLPAFNDGIVYRLEPYTEEEGAKVRNWYKANIGAFVRTPFFLSTSTESGDKLTILEIKTAKSSRGRDLGAILVENQEKEILFLANTIFQIVKVDDYIRLSEADEDSERHFDLLSNFYK